MVISTNGNFTPVIARITHWKINFSEMASFETIMEKDVEIGYLGNEIFKEV